MIRRQRVGVGRTGSFTYPRTRPFDPGEAYPELAGIAAPGAEPNAVYAAVRDSFRHLGLDEERAGTARWNPLGEIVKPGFRVLLKPNLVRHENHGPGGTDCLITHGSVLRPVLDYVIRALEGRGEIWIGDAPIQTGDFEGALRASGIGEVIDDARARVPASVAIHVADLRRTTAVEDDATGLAGVRRTQASDPNGLVAVDLGARSKLTPLDAGSERYRVTGYDAEETPSHHGDGRHEYLMSRTALTADAIINLPKLKTHRKAGMTCALKNLVGLNGDKAWLPHHRAGSVAEGGDEYAHPSSRKAVISKLDAEVDAAAPGVKRTALLAVRKAIRVTNRIVPFPDPFREGSWYGNDTIWRMVLDLNRAALYARDAGHFVRERRPWLNVVDAVLCGQNEGPIRPDPAHAGVVLAGVDSAMVDLACAKLAGFLPDRIPTVAHAFDPDEWPITDHRPEDLETVPELPVVPLVPSMGWRGWIEAAPGAPAAGDDPVPADQPDLC
ncbi:MAG: hypothetical protein HMLKMBBP_03324 [Planctomycetes bacterium]|nr:hypothetical protein [Planctomycetota bacterium]